MNDQSKTSLQPSHYFDIVPAEKAVPSATSRPVIVTNQSVRQDPMMQRPTTDNPNPSTNASDSVSAPSNTVQTAPTLHQEDLPSHQSRTPLLQMPEDRLYASIPHHQHRRYRQWLIVLCGVVLLMVIGVDLLLDSGVWQPTHNLPHTHLLHHLSL